MHEKLERRKTSLCMQTCARYDGRQQAHRSILLQCLLKVVPSFKLNKATARLVGVPVLDYVTGDYLHEGSSTQIHVQASLPFLTLLRNLEQARVCTVLTTSSG